MTAPLIHHQNGMHLRDIHAAAARDRLGARRDPVDVGEPSNFRRPFIDGARRLLDHWARPVATPRRLPVAR